MNKIVLTMNITLNEKLYAKVLTCLEGQVLQNMVSHKHLCADGLALLQELVQTYRPKNVLEVIAAKTGEFWSNTKRNRWIPIITDFMTYLMISLREKNQFLIRVLHIILFLLLDWSLRLFKIIFELVIFLRNGRLMIGLSY